MKLSAIRGRCGEEMVTGLLQSGGKHFQVEGLVFIKQKVLICFWVTDGVVGSLGRVLCLFMVGTNALIGGGFRDFVMMVHVLGCGKAENSERKSQNSGGYHHVCVFFSPNKESV